LNKGPLPDSTDLDDAQDKFIKERKDGKWNPVVGGVPVLAPPVVEGAIPAGSKLSTGQGRPVTNGAPRNDAGSLVEKKSFSVKGIVSVCEMTKTLANSLAVKLNKKFNKKRLSAKDKNLLLEVCKNIIISTEISKWEDVANKIADDFSYLSVLCVKPEVSEIAIQHQLDEYSAAILFHSNNETIVK
jgi:hypothetical protein